MRLEEDAIEYYDEIHEEAKIFLIFHQMPRDAIKIKHHKKTYQRPINPQDLITACSSGNAVLARKLLVTCKPNIHDRSGRTPLHFAVNNGDIDLAQTLLDYGADLNKKDSNGNTCLHLAVISKRIDMILFLLQMGADSKIEDQNGNKPIDLVFSRMKNIVKRNINPKRILEDLKQIIEILQFDDHISKEGKDKIKNVFKEDSLDSMEVEDVVDELEQIMRDFKI